MQINKSNLRVNGKLDYGNYPDKIILHHPEFNGSIQALNDIMINDGFSMIGYNYYVRKDGTVWEGRSVSAVGANCYGQNSCSIGVCFEGNFMKDSMGNAQYNSGVELLKYLLNKYPGIKEIGPHKKYYNTDCPGVNFPVDRMIKESMNGTGNYSESSGSIVLLFQRLCNREGIRDSSGNSLSEDGLIGNKTRSCIKKLPLLRIGSQGNIVCFLQKALNITGAHLNADGFFGELTRQAVINFQGALKLDMDGIVGSNTWSNLIK